MISLFDTHCHLDDEEFDFDRDEIIENFEKDHILALMNPGEDKGASKRAVDLSNRYEKIYAAVGSHPNQGAYYEDGDIDYYRNLAKSNKKVVAIGEIGLDYHYGKEYSEEQKRLFRLQMDLAQELKLPVSIHTREATKDTLDILSSYKGKVRGIMHCYSGSKEAMKDFLDLDYYIALGGVVTFKNAKKTVEVAKEVPLDRLLLETDAPYLTPHPYRGKRNEPKRVLLVAEKIGQIRGMSTEDLSNICYKNSLEIFNLDKDD